jgi:hypothetical protein
MREDSITLNVLKDSDDPIRRTLGVEKIYKRKKLETSWSCQEKNPTENFGYTEYMAHHYAFMINKGHDGPED